MLSSTDSSLMHVLSAIGPRNSSQIFLISPRAVAVFSLAPFGCYGASRSKRLLEAFPEFGSKITVWNRRHLAVTDRWFPSSKTCHACGAVKADLTHGGSKLDMSVCRLS